LSTWSVWKSPVWPHIPISSRAASGSASHRASAAVKLELILHDEVTSALDVSVQGSILNPLRNLQRRLNSRTCLFRMTSRPCGSRYRTAVMYLGVLWKC
jgi:ABC-type oligopeptide transport system ATPase subunit